MFGGAGAWCEGGIGSGTGSVRISLHINELSE